MTKDIYKIYIVCEGDEEYEYLDTLRKLKVWSNRYSIKLKNATSIDKIVSYFQHAYHSGSYDLVLVFCDTDMTPYKKYNDMKNNLLKFYASNEAVNNIIVYSNPCVMQIILLHFKYVRLESNIKSKNQRLIKELTGIKEYKATRHQLESIMKKINDKNYKTLKINLSKLGTKETELNSTNFLKLLTNLESNNFKWIVDEVYE